jgi:hypothetical protein
MRIQALLLILFFSAAASNAVDFPPPAKAKTVIQTFDSFSWDNTAGWVLLEGVKTIRETFDPDGRVLARGIFHGEDVLIEITRYAYSETGCQKTTYNGKNEVSRFAVTVKKATGTRETIHRPDGEIIAVYDTEYGRDGLPVRCEYADSEGALVWKIAYSYDAMKNCTTVSYFNSVGSLAFVSTLLYEGRDAAGNWIQCTQHVSYADVRNRPKDVIRRSVEYRE